MELSLLTFLASVLIEDRFLEVSRDFFTLQDVQIASRTGCLLLRGYPGYPVVKTPGRGVDHPLHLAPRLKKEYNYTSPPLCLHSLFQG